MSPTIRSSNPSMLNPHSRPCRTSCTSALNRFRAVNVVLPAPAGKTTMPSRSTRIRAERAIFPEVTSQPATVPTRLIVKTARTTARPMYTSCGWGTPVRADGLTGIAVAGAVGCAGAAVAHEGQTPATERSDGGQSRRHITQIAMGMDLQPYGGRSGGGSAGRRPARPRTSHRSPSKSVTYNRQSPPVAEHSVHPPRRLGELEPWDQLVPPWSGAGPGSAPLSVPDVEVRRAADHYLPEKFLEPGVHRIVHGKFDLHRLARHPREFPRVDSELVPGQVGGQARGRPRERACRDTAPGHGPWAAFRLTQRSATEASRR
jgi:hypothetical protein